MYVGNAILALLIATVGIVDAARVARQLRTQSFRD
jgi:hypothetical protein